jgi:DNA primase
MPWPADFLEELKARSGLAEIVGRHVRLIRRGRELTGLCPFHAEKTPSFTVSEDKGFFHCFGCGAHGNVIDFVMRIDGLDFREAVERLATAAGMTMPQERADDRARAARRSGLHDVVEAAARVFEAHLTSREGEPALAYLHRRGVDGELIARFRLGFALDARGALKAALARQGFAEDLMVEAGLLVRPEDGGAGAYDRFRGRVMFPITDRRGRVIAFGGRSLGDGGPKYLNSPETPLFHKGHQLYGLALAAPAARAAGSVIVAEGYMDVIGLHRAGFTNVVAPLGTALTAEQIEAMWRLAPRAVLLFDPDEAGRRAAVRAAERALPLITAGCDLRFAFVETDTADDPDGVTRRYPRQFIESALDNALSLSETLVWAETSGRVLRTAEDVAAVEVRLKRHAGEIRDAGVRAHVNAAFRDALWRLRRNDRRRGAARPGPARQRPVAGTPAQLDGEGRREEILVAVLLHHPEAVDRIGERLGEITLTDPALDSLRQGILSALADNPHLDSPALHSHLTGHGHVNTLDSLSGPRLFAHAAFARPDSDLEGAVAGWEETYSLFRQKDVERELGHRQRALSSRLSTEDYERFRVLKQHAAPVPAGHPRRRTDS